MAICQLTLSARHFTAPRSLALNEMVAPTQRRKAKFREEKPPSHGVTASPWQSWDLSPLHQGR